MCVASLQQDDERPGSDAADPDYLARHVHDLEPLQQVAPVVWQGGPVGAELIVERRQDVWSGDMPNVAARSRAGTMTGGWLTIRYCPSTTSASLDSACRLSRVCAFATFFSARRAAFFAVLRLLGSLLILLGRLALRVLLLRLLHGGRAGQGHPV